MGGASEAGAAGFSGLPGVRVFRSPRFRLILALGLSVLGVVLYALYFRILEGGYPPWLFDFSAYYHAAEAMMSGESPYSDAQLGAPVDAVCVDCYLYPPLLAQLLAPLTHLPIEAAKLLFLLGLCLAAIASTWLATGIGGAERSLERLLWSIAATLLFTPVFNANYYGNLGSLLALAATLVAMGGVVAGASAAVATLAKVSPGGLVLAVLAGSRSSRRSFIVTLVVVGGVSFLIAPQAWLDYATVLPNMLAGSTDYDFNLAPANVVRWSGWPDAFVAGVRAAAVAVGVLALGLSAWLARRPDGMPAAALAGTVAMLVIPSTLWTHYLPVLLPFAAMAWPRGGTWPRTLVLVGAILVSTTSFHSTFVLPYLGAVLMIGSAALVLWPRERRVR